MNSSDRLKHTLSTCKSNQRRFGDFDDEQDRADILRKEIQKNRKLDGQELFEDRLHHFVQTMKKLTYVQEVNIFSKEQVQIYMDLESQ